MPMAPRCSRFQTVFEIILSRRGAAREVSISVSVKLVQRGCAWYTTSGPISLPHQPHPLSAWCCKDIYPPCAEVRCEVVRNRRADGEIGMIVIPDERIVESPYIEWVAHGYTVAYGRAMRPAGYNWHLI